MSMLSDFLTEHGITSDEVVARSKLIEAQGVADRELMVKRETARRDQKSEKGGGSTELYEKANLGKARGYARYVSANFLKRACNGEKVSRMTRKKIARAVNSVLTSKKKDNVEWRLLFGDVGSKKGKKSGK